MKPLLLLVFCLLAGTALALGSNPNVFFSPRHGAFALLSKGIPAQIVLDSADWPGVARAAGDLQSDIARVNGGKTASAPNSPKILVGTIGHSPQIDNLIRSGIIDVKGIPGQWEASVTQVVEIPKEGRCLVIAGADKRGTIFALYDLSESIGVSPWNWWADVPVKHHDSLYVTGRYVAKSPAVKYRGIFLNDEAPSLSNWVYANYGNYNHAFYERIFELLLRLRANYLWPAMWNNSFSVDDPLNPELADEYGIVMGTSHVEPMMRADKEWSRLGFKDRQWNYATNSKDLEQFWRDGVTRNKPYENIVTIAMRGKVDTPMSESANIDLLEKIVDAQRHILAEAVNPDVTKIPQLWCLYKEVQEYYEKGMRVPDDVTLLWADDNWGDIRRLPTPEERHRSGGAGVYYHFDYVGGPRNYKWIDTNPISKIWEQMNLAYRYGANRIWIVNVGDLQPKAFSTEFFLTMARDPGAIKREDLEGYTRRWSEREFGPKYAKDIARIISETARLNGRRKPELVAPDTYSLINYREAERVSGEFNMTLGSAERIGKLLPAVYQPAYYELVIHPIKAPQVVTDLYIAAARNQLYARQGRASASDEAKKVRALFAEDAKVTADYHAVNGGKWNHFMDQTHIGYTTWQQPDRNIMPRVVEDLSVPATALMGVAVEGSTDVWLGADGTAVPARASDWELNQLQSICSKNALDLTPTLEPTPVVTVSGCAGIRPRRGPWKIARTSKTPGIPRVRFRAWRARRYPKMYSLVYMAPLQGATPTRSNFPGVQDTLAIFQRPLRGQASIDSENREKSAELVGDDKLRWDGEPEARIGTLGTRGEAMRAVPSRDLGVGKSGDKKKTDLLAIAKNPRLEFTRFGQRSRRIEVFARGSVGFAYSAKCSEPWVLLSLTSGIVTETNLQSQIGVSIAWAKIPVPQATAQITISGAGATQVVEVFASAPTGPIFNGSFLEGDGVVAIEAEHTSRRVAAQDVKWETIPGYGRTLSAVEPFPVEFKPFDPGTGPRMEYDLTTLTAGQATLDVVVAPSLAFQPAHGLRFAVAFDNDKPQVIDAASSYLSRDWERSVSDSVRHVLTKHMITPGRHTLKIWSIDPGVVIERVVVDLGGLKPSYLGPPESTRGRSPQSGS